MDGQFVSFLIDDAWTRLETHIDNGRQYPCTNGYFLIMCHDDVQHFYNGRRQPLYVLFRLSNMVVPENTAYLKQFFDHHVPIILGVQFDTDDTVLHVGPDWFGYDIQEKNWLFVFECDVWDECAGGADPM